jgi:hypothetical protein
MSWLSEVQNQTDEYFAQFSLRITPRARPHAPHYIPVRWRHLVTTGVQSGGSLGSLVLSSKVRQRLVPTLAPLFYASRCATMIMPAGAAWPHYI